MTLQLLKSSRVLWDNLGVEADLIAWPFGVYDELLDIARGFGYIAGFTIDRHLVTYDARVMALPRFLVTDNASETTFASMLPPGEQQ